jgi:hypothetical protein
VQTARAHHQYACVVGIQAIFRLTGRLRPAQIAAHRTLQHVLTRQHVGPSRRGRVLEICHEHIGARIKGVDHGLGIDRAGDFHAAVLQQRRHRCGGPSRLAQICGMLTEAGHQTFAPMTFGKQLPARRLEAVVQIGQECQCLGIEQADHRAWQGRMPDPGPGGVDSFLGNGHGRLLFRKRNFEDII